MKRTLLFTWLSMVWFFCTGQNGLLVLQTDFGLKDGAVAAMKGVAMQVSNEIKIFDLTHEIPPFNIWEAAYRLQQTAAFWPEGTVFVCVTDPGVGSDRKSIVAKTKSGHYFVSPDNGSLTLIAESMGIQEVRLIDETINRLAGSSASYTFHGRDVFAYTGARLTSRKITFEQIGPRLNGKLVTIPYQAPLLRDGNVKGTIPILDTQYGNIWTNINDSLVKKMDLEYGDSVDVEIYQKTQRRFKGSLPFGRTFSDAKEKQGVCYLNSLLNLSFALNMDDFAGKYGIGSGPDWTVVIRKGRQRGF